ncbi:MAG: type I-E CRISPR-associated protein Cse1/CasA [Planctomycetia bacterium]|nr:type I-E CRISPR-associated protein Cse1/CasA [Planctomycetia bacterium]
MIAEKKSFNLVDDPWIPIAGVGERSLRDVFEHPEYLRLGGTAVEKVVILRLLLCIVHASTPIPDEEAWAELTLEQISQNALAYLEKWHDRFDLYDEELPFLQFPQLKGKCAKAGLEGIAWTAASGNKTLLTQWSGMKRFSDAEAARLILCGTSYGSGGKKYDLKAKIDPAGPDKGKSASQGTLTGYSGYLHSFLLGETILETLYLNLLTEEEVRSLCLFRESNPLGCPFWEAMPTDEGGSSAEAYRSTYQGHLFPLNKFFCLHEDSLLMTEGISYPTHKQGQWDPGIVLFYGTKPEDTRALWCDTEKKPWRQLSSLLQFLDVNTNSTMPAFLIRGLDKMDRSHDRMFGIWTGGVGVNNNSGEQYVSAKKDYVESEFTIPMSWYEGRDEVRGASSFLRYKNLMQTLDDYASVLYSAVNRYFKSLDEQRSGDLAKQAVQLFWEKMEPAAQAIIDLSLEKEESEEVLAAEKAWQGVARSCYDQFCPHQTPRQIQAYVQGTPYFGKKSDKTKPVKKVKKEKV